MEMKRKPVREIRRGQVLARIWLNPDFGPGRKYSVTIVRLRYQDAFVRDTESFNHDDLVNVRQVAFWAHFWIWWCGGNFSCWWSRR